MSKPDPMIADALGGLLALHTHLEIEHEISPIAAAILTFELMAETFRAKAPTELAEYLEALKTAKHPQDLAEFREQLADTLTLTTAG